MAPKSGRVNCLTNLKSGVKVVIFKDRFSICNGGRCRACGLGDRCFVASNYNWHRHPPASQPTFCVLQPTTSVAKIARIENKFFYHHFYLNPVSPLSLLKTSYIWSKLYYMVDKSDICSKLWHLVKIVRWSEN